jgi:hypothetical protein
VLQEFSSVVTATMKRVIHSSTGRLAVQELTMQHVVQMTPALVLKAIYRSVADQRGPQAQRRRPSRNQLVWWCGAAPGRVSS